MDQDQDLILMMMTMPWDKAKVCNRVDQDCKNCNLTSCILQDWSVDGNKDSSILFKQQLD